MDSRLVSLMVVFAPLSLMSFGGGQAVVADFQYQTVMVHGWLTNQEFTDLFAISRASPGPSTLIVALIGWQVYGFIGAVTAVLAIYIPSSIVVYGATKWWHHNQKSPWRAAVERGLGPIAVGLVFAGVVAVFRAAGVIGTDEVNLLGLATALTAASLLYFNKISPHVLIGIVALFYGALQLF